MFYEKTENGLKICVRVSPKASANLLRGVEEVLPGQKALKVSVTAVPEDGRANKALIALLSKTFGVPKSSFQVMQGETSRLKVILITGDPSELVERIEGALQL